MSAVCLPWTPETMANAIIWKAPPSICHGCGFHVRQKLFPKAVKCPPSLIWFLSPLLSPVSKRYRQWSLVSHFRGCFVFCSSEDFQMSLASVPHLLYALGVHICSWQRCDLVPASLFFPSNPDEKIKNKKHASLSAFLALRRNPCPYSLLCISHLSADGALPVQTGKCTAQGMPFPERVLPDPAALPRQLSVRSSCHRCTLLGVREGRQAAVWVTLLALVEEDASRQYQSYNAACILLLRAPTCLC